MRALRRTLRFDHLSRFLFGPAAGGLALLTATVAALAWSNLSASYNVFWSHHLLGLALEAWVNDGLMTLFFLAVGLELRWELTEGALASPRAAAAPALAALGGMVVPALIYMAWNRSDPVALRGWAVPVATDIAFALAALSVLGARVPPGLRTFLTALAIIDDLLAIVVIALFYGHPFRLPWLLAEVALCLALLGLRRAGVRWMAIYLAGGVALWFAVRGSGVHPTMAGVLLAFLVPEGDVAERLERRLTHWITWLVLPLFGLANGGLVLGMTELQAGLAWGTMAALAIGKPIGVILPTLAAERLGLGRLPPDMSRRHLLGGAVLCGIGFTMSLFIGELAFHGILAQQAVKLGVFAGSVASAVIGLIILARADQVRLKDR